MRGKMFQVLCVASLIASVSFFTAGCAKKSVDSEGNGDSVKGSTTDTSPTTRDGAGTTTDTGDTAGSYESLDSGDSASKAGKYKIAEGRTHEGLLPIYFDFDKSNVRADQKVRLEGNAGFLNSNNVKITIEGNCDERGTNEYNIALGERRAQVAKKYLINLGVAAGKLSTVSYGEERPLLFGHDEYSWSQNRRDDFVIK